LLKEFKKSNLLLLKLILDDWSFKKSIKGIKKLEFSGNSITIIETLCKNRGKSSLKLLNSLSELVEVIIKGSVLNVHDIV